MSNNKIVLITGASSGIGYSIYQIYKKKGYTSIGLSRKAVNKDFIACDVRVEKEIKKAIEKVINKYNRIDILVNNVGIVSHQSINKESLSDWDNVMATNLTSYFLFCKNVLPHMKKRKFGKIINISSIAGRSKSPKASTAYVCSKYGIIGLTKQLAHLYAQDNININCICPGQTATPMLLNNMSKQGHQELINSIPLKRLCKPEEIAELVYYLSTDNSKYITGAVIDINGGQL